MVRAIRFNYSSAGPEPGAFQNNLGAIPYEEFIIACALPVLPDGVGDIGGNVDLQFTVRHLQNLPIEGDDRIRRCFISRVSRFPGIHRPPKTESMGLPS